MSQPNMSCSFLSVITSRGKTNCLSCNLCFSILELVLKLQYRTSSWRLYIKHKKYSVIMNCYVLYLFLDNKTAVHVLRFISQLPQFFNSTEPSTNHSQIFCVTFSYAFLKPMKKVDALNFTEGNLKVAFVGHG